MTTIVAIEKPGKTIFAADSQVSAGSDMFSGMVKIEQNAEYTFAAAGVARSIQVLQFASLPPIPKTSNEKELDRFFTVEIIPTLRKAFEEEDLDVLEESQFLVALRTRVYSVNGACGFWKRTETGLYAIGSGSRYALGALEAGAGVKKAIKIAGKYDRGTNTDVKIVTLLD